MPSPLSTRTSDVTEKRPRKFAYKTFGPLKFSAENLSQFWDEIENEAPKHRKGLRKSRGVYIFVTRATNRSPFIPRYVGKTIRGFEPRFNEHSRAGVFRDLEQKHGKKLHVFLLALKDKEGALLVGKQRKLASVGVLETLLIERCLQVNPDLQNLQQVRYVKGLEVPGFINSPKQRLTGPATRLRSMLGRITTKEL